MTRWEEVAKTRWGSYVSGVEREEIEAAVRASGRHGTALDVGCEGGRWTRMLLAEGWSVTSIDVDASAVAACAETAPQARCLVVDPTDKTFPVASGSLDLLVCIEVREVVHSDWFAAEATRVLAPGGRLVAVVWNLCSARGVVAALMSWVRRQGGHPFYRTSYRSWRRALESSDLQLTAQRGVCWFPFGRSSNSRLVPPAVRLERALRLDALPTFSPWVVVTARRSGRVRAADHADRPEAFGRTMP